MLNEANRERNRRSESRFQPCLEEILWRSEGATRRSLRGCLRDISDKGLSFITARQPAPGIGQHLHVHLLGTQECAPCRVVWVEPGRQLAAIGCRLVQSAPQTARPTTPPKELATSEEVTETLATVT